MLFGGELAEGFQRGDGGLEERLIARSFLAAGRGFRGIFFRVLVLGGGELGILRAPPAVHRLAVDGGALGLGEDALLPGGGACPAFFELAEVAGDDQRLGAEFFGHLRVGKAFQEEAFDLGQERILADRRRIFFADFFVHGFLAFFSGN